MLSSMLTDSALYYKLQITNCNTLNVQSHVSFYALILPDEAHWGKVEYCGCANLLINNLLALMLRIQPAKSVSTMVQALWLTLNKAQFSVSIVSLLHVVNISLVSVLLTAECFTCTDLSPVFSLSRPHPNTCILLFTEQALYYMADEKGSRSSVWIQSPNWKKMNFCFDIDFVWLDKEVEKCLNIYSDLINTIYL